MKTSVSLDHFVIAVRDLAAAADSYRELGFTVSSGGRHTHTPTRNALIYLLDGSYLELIEWMKPSSGDKWYDSLERWGEGLVDFALVPADLDATLRAASRAGYRQPVNGSRIRPDGKEVRWQLAWPSSAALPFLCSDVTDRRLRVPEGPVRVHANGAVGVAEVSVCVRDIERAAEDYRALFAWGRAVFDQAARRTDRSSVNAVTLPIGDSRIRLVSPISNSSSAEAQSLRQRLGERGEGPYNLVLSSTGEARAANAHGVSLKSSL